MEQDIQQETEKLLAQLHDISAPAVHWWPPAPGWWLLLLLLVVLFALLGRAFLARHRRVRWVQFAETELRDLEQAFSQGDLDSRSVVAQLSVLMRRSAIAARGRTAVARATDERWIDIIREVGDGAGFGRSAALVLIQAPYKAQSLPDAQVKDLLQACAAWLKGARKVSGKGHD